MWCKPWAFIPLWLTQGLPQTLGLPARGHIEIAGCPASARLRSNRRHALWSGRYQVAGVPIALLQCQWHIPTEHKTALHGHSPEPTSK